MKQTFKAGLVYFAMVFAAGFILGAIRVPFLVPRLGERAAELIEMPFMLVAIILAARFITKRFAVPTVTSARLGTGILALLCMFLAEFLLATVLAERSLGEYIASRDPVSGSVYLAMLGLFAAMPLIIGRYGRSEQ